MSKIIKILGTGCPKCKTTTALVEEVVKENNIDAKIIKVEDIMEILGKPDNNIKVELDTIKNWNYYMGIEGHGMGWKFHYLDLYFEKGNVESANLDEFID